MVEGDVNGKTKQQTNVFDEYLLTIIHLNKAV